MLSILICMTFLSLITRMTKQTTIVFDNPTWKTSPRLYAQQFCLDVEPNACCTPLNLQVFQAGGPGRGWFKAQHTTFHLDRPQPINEYVTIFSYDGSRTACDGREVKSVLLAGHATWDSEIYTEYPELSGGVYLERSKSKVGGMTVYPDVVTYLGVNYTDGKRGDGVYKSGKRVIYGRPLFRKWSSEALIRTAISLTSRFSYPRCRE